MVAITAAMSREKIARGISSVKCSGGAGEVAPKLDQLRRLRSKLLAADSELLVDFLSPILDLLSEDASPVRKYVTQMVGQIGLKHMELLPEMVPAVIDVLVDDTPAVVRQAITSSIKIFRSTLVKVAVQGLYSSEFSESLKSSWACVQKLRDEIYSMAFKVGSDGRRLAALKFVESVILLYTPDPNGSSNPPPDQISDANFEDFNVSWLRGGHPILNAGDMSVEASRSLGLLLDQLRPPSLKSHSNLMIIVLIKSLSTIARKRPAFYGRILPVLLGLDPSSSFGSDMHLGGVRLALKNAFEACLNCSHPGAAPWRDRLVSAITDIKAGKPTQVKGLGEDDGRAVWREDPHVARIHEEEKSPMSESPGSSAGRKRSAVLAMPDLSENEGSGKRARSTPGNLEGSWNDMSGKLETGTLSEPTPSEPDALSEPVQQLVAMFGALAAQGEKAAASLDILIASISADLLAEVVMANLRNLPLNCPRPEGDGERFGNVGAHPGMAERVTHLRHLNLLLTGVLSDSKSSAGKESRLSVADKLEQAHEELQVATNDINIAYDSLTPASQPTVSPIREHASAENIISAMETSYTSEVNDSEVTENEIPGVYFSAQDGAIHENVPLLSTNSADLDDYNQSGGTPVDIGNLMSIERSEELSPKAAMTNVASIDSSSATSHTQLVLPKISAPVVHLADAQKDELQELAFGRIVDAYKQVAVAGGSQVRFSVLAHSGMEFPSELDPWKLLKTHILTDYKSYEGHELTLRVLYRLYGEAEEDRDFFSSTTATSVYETFLLQVAETLRDSFPASDKSLGRLLAEVPYLPKSVLEMLEQLCSPGTSENDDKELHGGDRVTQGLSTAWNLILSRPPIRDACLKICLKCAVHHLEEIRMKAIRLVANKLYPLSSISGKIEDFAKEMLVSVVRNDEVVLTTEADRTRAEMPKDKSPSGENPSASSTAKDISSESQQLTVSESISHSALVEVQRCMSLYFALCTKKHSLLRQIFDVYEGTSKAAKQAIHSQIPLLVRTIGSSRDLLSVLSDPPTGSQGLVTQVVNTLTDGIVPSPDLVSTIKGLYNTKLKDVDILIPVLPFLEKDEVLLLFPHLVNTPMDKFQVILSRLIQGFNNSTPLLTPTEALIAIHGIDPDKVGIPLRKVTDACNVCFEQRQVFTQQVLAKVLNQLVEQIPLPLLFMRTVLQAIGAFPGLVDFIMEILSRLVSKQIWKYPKQWVGFMKCALLTKPQSFKVLLQLPSAQLENALNRTSALKAPLVAHASQLHIRSSLTRSTLVVLGIETEAQPSASTPPPPQAHSGIQSEAQSSDPTPPPQAHSGIQSEAQSSDPTPPPPPSQTQTGGTETEVGETGESEKEEVTEKSKESSPSVT